MRSAFSDLLSWNCWIWKKSQETHWQFLSVATSDSMTRIALEMQLRSNTRGVSHFFVHRKEEKLHRSFSVLSHLPKNSAFGTRWRGNESSCKEEEPRDRIRLFLGTWRCFYSLVRLYSLPIFLPEFPLFMINTGIQTFFFFFFFFHPYSLLCSGHREGKKESLQELRNIHKKIRVRNTSDSDLLLLWWMMFSRQGSSLVSR